MKTADFYVWPTNRARSILEWIADNPEFAYAYAMAPHFDLNQRGIRYHLEWLELCELIEGEWVDGIPGFPRRKMFKITDYGRKRLEAS